MKLLIEILALLFLSVNDGVISMKEKLEKTPASTLPFEATSKAPWGKPGFDVAKKQWQNLPIFTYVDLGMTKHNSYNEEVTIFRKFTSSYNNYCIVVLKIGVTDPGKELLVTYDNEGNVLDFLETSVYWGGVERLCIKHWKISDKREITVSWIKVLSNNEIQCYDKFSTLQGQRIDTHYLIDSKGKFQKIKEIRFEPKDYTKAYLESDPKLWEGDEIIKEEVAFN